jgi:hypothetical protein
MISVVAWRTTKEGKAAVWEGDGTETTGAKGELYQENVSFEVIVRNNLILKL